MHFTKFTEKHLWWSPFLLKSQPGTLLKKLHNKCFSTTFVKFFKILILCNAGEQLFLIKITYKTKTEQKGSTDHKNTITFQIKKKWKNFFSVAPILKPVFTEVKKKIIKATCFTFAEMLWTLAEHGGQGGDGWRPYN